MSQPRLASNLNPPLDVFEAKASADQVAQDKINYGNILERVEYPEEGDMIRHYYDKRYPAKGHPFSAAVDAIQAPKKLIVSTGRFLEKHWFIAGLFFALPSFIRDKWIKDFLDIYFYPVADGILRPYFLEEKRYTRMVREIRRAALLVVPKDHWESYYHVAIRVLVAILQWDDAYRYRIQDIVQEIDKKAFKDDPAKELMRLVTLQVTRERGWHENKGKFITLGKAVKLAIRYSAALKKVMVDFIQELNIDEAKLDEADEYWCLMRADYDIHGWPMEYRQEKYIKLQTEYVEKNPERMAEGDRAMLRSRSTGSMMSHLMEKNGLPLAVFYVVKENNEDMLKMLEIGAARNNLGIRKSCYGLLAEEIKKNEQPV